MASLLISIEIEKDQGDRSAGEMEERVRAALADVEAFEIEDMAIRTPANIDPAALQEVVALLRSAGDVAGVAATAVGAATLVIVALRKLAKESAALIRTVAIEIRGERRPIETITPEELADEMNRSAVD